MSLLCNLTSMALRNAFILVGKALEPTCMKIKIDDPDKSALMAGAV